MSRTHSYREGAKKVAPLAPAAASFGVAYGVLAVTAGMGVLAPIVMSATTFAGASQFAAASVLRDGGSVLAAVAAAVLLNARYLAIGFATAPAFEGSRLRRFFESQLIVDEAWAVSQVGGGRIDRRLLVGAGLLLYPCWVAGGALGVFGGDILGDPEALRPGRRVSRALSRPAAHAHRESADDPRGRCGRPDRACPAADRPAGRARDRGRRRLPGGAEEPMRARPGSSSLLVGAFTIAFKAAGPVLLGGRELPARLTDAFELLAPSLSGRARRHAGRRREEGIVLDERLVGVGAAIVAVPPARAADRGDRRRGAGHGACAPPVAASGAGRVILLQCRSIVGPARVEGSQRAWPPL